MPPGTAGRWLVHGMRAAVVALLVAGLGQCFSTDEEVAQVWFFVLTAALLEARVETTGNRAPLKRVEKWFKSGTLPLARRLFVRGAVSGRVPPARILVVRPDDRLGNLLLMTPFLKRLRETNPNATIGMVVGSIYAPLLRGWPWVDTWIVQDKRAHIRAPWTFISWLRGIRRGAWDVAFEMSNHNTHSYYSCLLTLVSGAPVRVGFDEARNRDTLSTAVLPPGSTRHFSLAPLELLRPLGADVVEAPISCPLPRLAVPLPIDTREPYIVVHVGGRGRKALPAPAWQAIIMRALDVVSGRIIVIAGPDELDRVPNLGASGGRVIVAPTLDIVTLAYLLGGARAYAGCDTGVMHLAVAVGTPTVALFFRSNPYHYAPLGLSHTTILLENPYGVTPAAWQAPDGSAVRSRLVHVLDDSTAGIDQAVREIVAAIVAAAGSKDSTLAAGR
jgi:ADP-heptose:LPS heptosyltransferase